VWFDSCLAAPRVAGLFVIPGIPIFHAMLNNPCVNALRAMSLDA
jgi:hypothetical protein